MEIPQKPKGFNFSLPDPVAEAFKELSGAYGPKQKWAVMSAAIVALLNLDPAARNLLIREAISTAGSAEAAADFLDRNVRGRATLSGKSLRIAASKPKGSAR